MKKLNHLLALLAVGLLAAPMVVQAQYDYQMIDHPGGPDAQVFGINDRGDAVGTGYIDADTLPFVYAAKKGTLTDVASMDGADTAVLGISDSGVMVGSVDNDAFIRDKQGTFTVFSHPDALSYTDARAINNKGLVTGFRNRLGPDPFPSTVVSFIYDPKSDAYTDIIPPTDHAQSIAQGINSAGVAVGSARFFAANDPCNSGALLVRYGWRRATDGTVTYFSVNGGGTAARGINDKGTIVGFVNGDTGVKGFVVTLDGSQCQSITIADADLLAPSGAVVTFAQGIKNSGEIVGSFEGQANSHGFIATPQ